MGARPRRQGTLGALSTGIKLANNLADARRERERERSATRGPRLTAPPPETSPSQAAEELDPMPMAEPDEPEPMPMAEPEIEPEETAGTMVRMPDMPVMPPMGGEARPLEDAEGDATTPPPATTTPAPGPSRDGAPASRPSRPTRPCSGPPISSSPP